MNISEIQDLIDRLDEVVYGSITERATGMDVCKKLVALQSELYSQLDTMLDSMDQAYLAHLEDQAQEDMYTRDVMEF